MAGNFPASFDGKALPEFFMYRLYFTPPPTKSQGQLFRNHPVFAEKQMCSVIGFLTPFKTKFLVD